jgi:hypothetical protein
MDPGMPIQSSARFGLFSCLGGGFFFRMGLLSGAKLGKKIDFSKNKRSLSSPRVKNAPYTTYSAVEALPVSDLIFTQLSIAVLQGESRRFLGIIRKKSFI